jgi:hypothetical protein
VGGPWGAVFLLREVLCRIQFIEQNVAPIWRKSVAPSLRYVVPQPKCEPTIRGWQSTRALQLVRRGQGAGRAGLRALIALTVRPNGWRFAHRRVSLGRRTPGPSHPSARRSGVFLFNETQSHVTLARTDQSANARQLGRRSRSERLRSSHRSRLTISHFVYCEPGAEGKVVAMPYIRHAWSVSNLRLSPL